MGPLLAWPALIALWIAAYFFERAPVPMAGRYELLVCTVQCEYARQPDIVARGEVLFLNRKIVPESLPPKARDNFYGRSLFMISRRQPNACFAVQTLKEETTFIGIFKAGFTGWSQDGNLVETDLYRSPDARAQVLMRGDEAVLRGRSYEQGDEVLGSPFVLARRRGPADLQDCIRIVERDSDVE